MTRRHVQRLGPPAARAWVAEAAILALLALVLGLPAASAVREAALAWGAPVSAKPPVTGSILDGATALRTLAFPLAIGILATLLAWPAAWAIRAGGRRAALAGILVLLPLLMPAYLAFAGWRLVHAPATWLGDRFALAPVWLQVGFDRALAVLGLALWSAPIAALILCAGLAHVPGGALESLRLDGAGRRARAEHILRMSAGPTLGAVAVVTLVMLGSAVPIHLSQIDTLAQRLWLQLQLAPTGHVWMAAWPLLLTAGFAAWFITRRLARPPASADLTPVRAAAGPWVGLGALVVLAVVAPLALFADSLRSVRSLGAFWTDAGGALGTSAAIAGAVGVIVGALTLLTWRAASARPGSRVVRLALLASIAAGLLPGVLVGQGVSGAWSLPGLGAIGDWLDGLGGRVVLAHVARFGFVGILAGFWLSRAEPADLRDTRRVDGAEGLRGWLRACLRPAWPLVPGVALAAAALSLHEIESAVIVSPPGSGTLPQRLLEMLHYNRDEQLAAAAVNVLGLGLLVALMAACLLARGARGRSPAEPPRPFIA